MKKILWFFRLISFKDHQAKMDNKEKSMALLRADLMELCNSPESFQSQMIVQKYKAKEGFGVDHYFFSPKDRIFINTNN